MELRQLRYFVVLAEELHFGRAAGRLRIATPTLSQQLAALERSLGQRLLDRTSQRVTLTPAGAALLEEARLTLAAAERARAATAAAEQLSHQVDVRVATGLEQLLAPQLAALTGSPGETVHLSPGNGLDNADAVRTGRADAAFVWVRGQGEIGLRSVVVARPAVWLAVPAQHRLAALDPVPVAALTDVDVALFPRHLSPGVWDAFHDHLLPAGPSRPDQVLHEPLRLEPMRGMLRAVAQGRAVAPFVRDVALRQDLLPDGVVLRPLDPPLTLPVELLWRAPARPRLQTLIEQVLACSDGESGPDEASPS